MGIAIVHYHLDPGGVTRVIESASRALTAAGMPHVVLHGGEKALPALGYLREPGSHTVESLLSDLRHAAKQALGAPPDLWHFHNHSLGKNCLIAGVVAELAAAGERLISQIHDLAEDGRPENFSVIADVPTLYPSGENVCYAFINSRDRAHFIRAGLPAAQAVLLPNPVESALPAPPLMPGLLFAPSRGIRRKNLGELLLLAALLPAGFRIAVSRAPVNPTAQPIYEFWKNLGQRLELPIEFEVTDRLPPAAGAGTDFASWIAHASHFVSTAVAEGFGLPFLEAAALGKPLIAREISHLQQGAAASIYQRILLPRDWVSAELLRRHLEASVRTTQRDYQRDFSQESFDEIERRHYGGDELDFATLPEALQRVILEKIRDPSARAEIFIESCGTRERAVAWLDRALRETPAPTLLEHHSLASYQERLAALYSLPIPQAPGLAKQLPAPLILDAYLQPGNFQILCASRPKIACLSSRFRAVIFDIYGTLLIAPQTGVRVDPAADPRLRDLMEQHGYPAPNSPSSLLHAAVLRHHAASPSPFPEVDLRELWREILELGPDSELDSWVETVESIWHPSRLMPGAEALVKFLAAAGIPLGLLSNAQCNTLPALGALAEYFQADLSILSYQEGIAKPAPALFEKLVARLARRGILPQQTLFVGNDPRQDILPAQAVGFQTALFTGHPASLRPGDCQADATFTDFLDLIS